VGIERGQHPVYGPVDELLRVHLLHIVLLHYLENIGEKLDGIVIIASPGNTLVLHSKTDHNDQRSGRSHDQRQFFPFPVLQHLTSRKPA